MDPSFGMIDQDFADGQSTHAVEEIYQCDYYLGDTSWGLSHRSANANFSQSLAGFEHTQIVRSNDQAEYPVNDTLQNQAVSTRLSI